MEFIFHYIHGTSLKILFVCGRGGCYMYMYIKNVLSCLLHIVEIISTFILIFANSIMDDFHINTEDVMVQFWPYLIIINIIVHMYA